VELTQEAKCALSNCNAMQVKFLLRQSIVVSFTLTASLETAGWEARENGAYLRVRWTHKIGTSDYDDMENRNVNGCSLVNGKQVNPLKCLWLIKQRIWAIVFYLL